MLNRFIFGLFGVALFINPADAACSWTALTNGNTADANQVMNDLNCLAPLANPSFTGNVGIGTTTPSQKFEVSGNALIDSTLYVGNTGTALTEAYGSLQVTTPYGYLQIGPQNSSWAHFYTDRGNFYFNRSIYASGSLFDYDGNYEIAENGNSYLNGGNVGIGTTTPSYTLQVNGTVAGSSAYTNLSDERLKKNIRPIQNALQIVEQIRGVSFRWRTPAERRVGKDLTLPVNDPQIGFIAQDLRKVLPQAVSVAKGKDAIMSVAESKVVPVLVEAIKELKAANDKLAAANVRHSAALRRLEEQVAQIQRSRIANTSNRRGGGRS